MNIYAISVDGSIPVPALLFPDEELLAGQDDVGLYNGWVNNPRIPYSVFV
jgi:ESCRT-II complex subunit VPS36